MQVVKCHLCNYCSNSSFLSNHRATTYLVGVATILHTSFGVNLLCCYPLSTLARSHPIFTTDAPSHHQHDGGRVYRATAGKKDRGIRPRDSNDNTASSLYANTSYTKNSATTCLRNSRYTIFR